MAVFIGATDKPRKLAKIFYKKTANYHVFSAKDRDGYYLEQWYRDSVTKSYARMLFEEELENASMYA